MMLKARLRSIEDLLYTGQRTPDIDIDTGITEGGYCPLQAHAVELEDGAGGVAIKALTQVWGAARSNSVQG